MIEKKIDLESVIDRIQNENIEKLRDSSYLEFKLLPELGLNDRHMHQYPAHLHPYCGIGIDSWQYPNQFSRYLTSLVDKNISSYVEIGCHKGGTFIITVEFLSRFNKINSAVAVDGWYREIMKKYSKLRPEVTYISDSSSSQQFQDAYKKHDWDLVLVDGDHSYQGAKDDFMMIRDNCRYTAFHDIKNIFCPGTQQLWHELCQEYSKDKMQSWCDQYDDVLLKIRGSIMGIGLIDMR